MGGICEGVEQGHRNGFHTLGEQALHRPFRFRGLQRSLNLAVRVHPFIDPQAQVSLNQRRGLLPGKVIEPWHAQGADFQHIAKALGGDQTGPGSTQLKDGIGGDGRAMNDLIHVGRTRAGFPEDLDNALDYRQGVVLVGGGDLSRVPLSRGIQENNIGEGSADIHAHPVSAHRSHPLAMYVQVGSRERIHGVALPTLNWSHPVPPTTRSGFPECGARRAIGRADFRWPPRLPATTPHRSRPHKHRRPFAGLPSRSVRL